MSACIKARSIGERSLVSSSASVSAAVNAENRGSDKACKGPLAVKKVGYSGSIARSPNSVLLNFFLLILNDDGLMRNPRSLTKGAPSGKASDRRSFTVRVNNAWKIRFHESFGSAP